tara:strand:+ start:1334 stop:2299 length:966 start_codon:yes stop_codon:yes gene_type:complete
MIHPFGIEAERVVRGQTRLNGTCLNASWLDADLAAAAEHARSDGMELDHLAKALDEMRQRVAKAVADDAAARVAAEEATLQCSACEGKPPRSHFSLYEQFKSARPRCKRCIIDDMQHYNAQRLRALRDQQGIGPTPAESLAAEVAAAMVKAQEAGSGLHAIEQSLSGAVAKAEHAWAECLEAMGEEEQERMALARAEKAAYEAKLKALASAWGAAEAQQCTKCQKLLPRFGGKQVHPVRCKECIRADIANFNRRRARQADEQNGAAAAAPAAAETGGETEAPAAEAAPAAAEAADAAERGADDSQGDAAAAPAAPADAPAQ